LGQAFAEYGRIDKTLHLLAMVDPVDESYRRRVTRQLNIQVQLVVCLVRENSPPVTPRDTYGSWKSAAPPRRAASRQATGREAASATYTRCHTADQAAHGRRHERVRDHESVKPG